jgi:hypothetical protein
MKGASELLEKWHAAIDALPLFPQQEPPENQPGWPQITQELKTAAYHLLPKVPPYEKQLGWPGITEELKTRLYRCNPVGVKSIGIGFHAQHCKQLALCPFCCGRDAADYWKRIDFVLFPQPPGGEKPDRACYDIVEVRRTIELPEVCFDEDAQIYNHGFTVARQLRRGENESARFPIVSQRTERRWCRCEGSVEHMSFDFAGEGDRLIVHINQLFAVKPGERFSFPSQDGDTYLHRQKAPLQQEVADTVSRIFRFPEHVLSAAAGRLKFYLSARHKQIMSMSRGVFRAKHGSGRNGEIDKRRM